MALDDNEWSRDHNECLRGMFGDWWRLRAERAVVDRKQHWRSWRDIRMYEQPPERGNLRVVEDR